MSILPEAIYPTILVCVYIIARHGLGCKNWQHPRSWRRLLASALSRRF